RVAAASTRRRKRVVIRDPEEESTAILPADTKSKDKGKGIMIEEPKPMKKKQQVEMDKKYARKLHEELNKDIDWDVAIDHIKQKAKEDPQQIKETYHVTFDESMEAIRFDDSVDEIRIDDSSRYPLDEFLHEDDPSRQYQVYYDISYYVIPHRRSLTKLTQENHVHEVIVLNDHDVPLTEDIEDPHDLINTERTHEHNV
nr:retrovirus-related Pol polyprotein from transposon TNT 1-94 [Tanacetum cinerariifolium]